ncbi:hypothetical protein [Streptomyces sp. NPDC056721]|uniref:hypothetical protein n=1 Tax=unclassified Streptomyces TaxID=2593676 RepID=UPI0036A87A12
MGSWIIAVVVVAGGSSCLRLRAGRRLIGLMSASLIVAFFTYLLGSGEVLFADPARMCEPTVPIPDWDYYQDSLFPPSAACHWADGRTHELVSAWITPVLLASLIVAIACVIAFAITRWLPAFPRPLR